ncbi:hypothetical protein Tco_0363877 [Tanacetum coccineum]
MNPEETQQVVAREEKWVPLIERVKISSTNVILETTVPQKEETFQVVIDLVKNSSCFKAFKWFGSKVLKPLSPKTPLLRVPNEWGIMFVLADSSSSIPADYVSAGHVLVPADRDRIC